jgi:septal ring factor EnvC (AmiA/AmiB activator)
MIMKALLANCVLLVSLVSLGLSTARAEPAKESSTAGKPPATSTPQDDAGLSRLLASDETRLAALEAELQDAKTNLELAKLALVEYKEGTYILEKQIAELDLFLAKERVRRSQRVVERIKAQAAGGKAAASDVEDSEFELNEAQLRSQIAETKLHILEQFTKDRVVTRLSLDIKAADTYLTKLEHGYRILLEHLKQREARSAKPAAEKAPPAAKGRD